MAVVVLSAIVGMSLTLSLAVRIVNPCGEVCDSDVELAVTRVRYLNSSGDPQVRFTAGAVTVVEVQLQYNNRRGPEDAIGATLSFNLPTLFTRSIRAGVEGNRDCTTIDSTVSCNLPNPLRPADGIMTETFMLVVSDQITGNEQPVDIIFSLGVSQGSRENNTANNNATRRLTVSGEANIFVTLSESASVQHAPTVPEVVNRADQLGPQVQVLVTVSNRGPTTIQNARLVTYFPARSATTGNYYFLYPIQAMQSAGSDSTVVCDVSGLNPDMLQIISNRRRRSVTSPSLQRTPRQVTSSGLNCVQDPDSCLSIVCNITRLDPDVNAEVNIISFVDDRFYAGTMTMTTYTLVVYSRVNITDDFLLPEANEADNTAQSALQVGPTEVVSNPDNTDNTLLIHAIIWPTLAVFIIIVILAIILYSVGFFRRKKRPEEGEAVGDFDVNKFQVQPVTEVPEEKETVEATQL